MDVRFFFGPDKIPFGVQENGMVDEASIIPFHGIISRGLISKLQDNQIHPEVWNRYAHLLDSGSSNNPEFRRLRKLASECKVLSFGQSALCAKRFVESYPDDLFAADHLQCDLWNLKEGHTSSVWKASVFDQNLEEHHFIVNVSRDYMAGLELEKTSRQMQGIAAQCPNINMAKVQDIQKLLVNDDNDTFEVVATRNEWIENAFEIHALKIEPNGKEQLVLVERFLTEADDPSHITSIHGRKLTETESLAIENDIALFLTAASLTESPIPGLNINEGDVVWNGSRAIVVAIS